MKRVISAVLMIILLVPGLGLAAENEADVPDRSKLGVFVPSAQPAAAPAIALTTPSGNTVDLAEFKGRLVLINLWATWCEPCLREMASLERLQSRLGERIAVLAVSEDRGGAKTVEPFIDKLELKSVKIYIDPKSSVGQAFVARGLPTTLLIDRDGKVQGRVEGAADWDSPEIMTVLERLVAGDAIVKTSSH
jgi:thiol-disulfide isomerase/thioredoxin